MINDHYTNSVILLIIGMKLRTCRLVLIEVMPKINGLST